MAEVGDEPQGDEPQGDEPGSGELQVDEPQGGEPVSGKGRSSVAPGPGARQAILVGGAVVFAVLLAAAATFSLPGEVRDVVFRTPLLIGVLIVGTAAVLWRITRPARPGQPDQPTRPDR